MYDLKKHLNFRLMYCFKMFKLLLEVSGFYLMQFNIVLICILQVLTGDIEEAICAHALYYSIWRRFGALPERFNWQNVSPDLAFYPLRPELIESTYLLYQATKNPFYFHVGQEIIESLNKYSKAE